MKRHIVSILITACLCCTTACDRDEMSDGTIFDTSVPYRNEVDQWLYNNFTLPYNIDVKYKWEDLESAMTYDLSPASADNAYKLAKIIHFVWLEAYVEVAGKDFIRTYVPKQILMVGSPAYNADSQTTTLGTAEGGLKVNLYDVNSISRFMDQPQVLNDRYFHTMHHEFSHILHQTKNYDTTFKTITESDYVGSQWETYTAKPEEANRKGFVTAYAMDQPDEDFAEVISTYVTNDQAYWDSLLVVAGPTGAPLIRQKFDIVEKYMLTYWNIDLTELRRTVLRRSAQVGQLEY